MTNKDAANAINNFFASLTSDFPEVETKWSGYGHLDTVPVVTLESLEKKLSSINSNKAPGPSDPCLKIIKIFSKSFAVPLADIFNTSFLEKTFLRMWKQIYVTAIPKVNPCTDLDDLRPISLTNTLSKIQECYVVDWMHEDIKDGICSEQYGGVPGSSALLALVHLLHKLNQVMDTPDKVITIIFLDFRKAFDLTDHNVLLENCCKIGVRPALIGWLSSYLCNRSQVTKFENELSASCVINGGVP